METNSGKRRNVQDIGASAISSKNRGQNRGQNDSESYGGNCGGKRRQTQREIGRGVDLAVGKLKLAGFKSTKARRKLLETALKIPAPFTADELFRAVATEGFDLVTVYRSLATFLELGVFEKIELDDGISRYEAKGESGTHHHHFVCTICRKIEPIDTCEIEKQEASLRARGYQAVSHRLEFFGTCPDCR